MKLSKGVEWALHCTWTLAAAPSTEPISTRRLAEFYDLPGPYLAKVLSSLVRAGVLTATSGPRGGFRLARPADEITAAEVVEAVEGRGQLFSCTEIRQRGPVPLTGAACRMPCGISRLMDRAERAWRNELAATSIADLVGTKGVGAPGRMSKWLETTAQNEGDEG
jgi:Rrf2 family protein